MLFKNCREILLISDKIILCESRKCSLSITNSDNFPSLLTCELQEFLQIRRKFIKIVYKFEVDSTADPILYFLIFRKVELSSIKNNAKLQLRVKNR